MLSKPFKAFALSQRLVDAKKSFDRLPVKSQSQLAVKTKFLQAKSAKSTWTFRSFTISRCTSSALRLWAKGSWAWEDTSPYTPKRLWDVIYWFRICSYNEGCRRLWKCLMMLILYIKCAWILCGSSVWIIEPSCILSHTSCSHWISKGSTMAALALIPQCKKHKDSGYELQVLVGISPWHLTTLRSVRCTLLTSEGLLHFAVALSTAVEKHENIKACKS